MSQLRLGYPQFQAQGAEVVAIAATPPERGAQFDHLYKFPHPYLCDPERATARRYGVRASVGAALRKFAWTIASSAVRQEMRRASAESGGRPAEEARAMLTGQMEGFFVIDKVGIVRCAHVGAGAGLLPSNAEIIRLLSGLSGAS